MFVHNQLEEACETVYRLFIKNIRKCVISMNSWDIDYVWLDSDNIFEWLSGSGTTLSDAGRARTEIFGWSTLYNRIGTDREWNRKCEIPEMMSLGNDFVSGPITAKGVSVAIRSYPKKLQKSRGARRCPSSSPKGSDGLGWAFHHGEGCCQGVAMCPDGHRRRSIIRALEREMVHARSNKIAK